jgi:tripartite-type tricarboxylate transporter receptor subunit TctC
MDSIATSVALPFIEAGEVSALAVGERQRIDSLPDVPTVGGPDFPDCEFSGWLGLFTPSGTPPSIIDRISGGFTSAPMCANVLSHKGYALQLLPI